MADSSEQRSRNEDFLLKKTVSTLSDIKSMVDYTEQNGRLDVSD